MRLVISETSRHNKQQYQIIKTNINYDKKSDNFRLRTSELSGRILNATPDANAIFLHNDLVFHDMCSVGGGA